MIRVFYLILLPISCLGKITAHLIRTGIEGSDDEALDTGQDEEVSRWEQEQIRKGISIPQVSCFDSLAFYSFYH